MGWSRSRHLLGLLSILYGHGALCGYEDRVPGTTTLYDFPRENCLSDLIELSAPSLEGWFGDLGLSDTVACNNGTGIRGSGIYDISPAVSKGEAYGLPARIGDPLLSNGITLELWLKHPEGNDLNGIMEIIGIRPPSSDSEGSPILGVGCDLCLIIADGAYVVVLDNGETKIIGYDGGGNGYQHVVVTIDAKSFSMSQVFFAKLYIDSSVVETAIYPPVNSGSSESLFENNQWKSTNHLHMLGSGNLVWPGSIYLAAIYTRVLTDEEVQQNYAAGLQKPIPVVFNAAITINEDGEVGDHYDNP